MIRTIPYNTPYQKPRQKRLITSTTSFQASHGPVVALLGSTVKDLVVTQQSGDLLRRPVGQEPIQLHNHLRPRHAFRHTVVPLRYERRRLQQAEHELRASAVALRALLFAPALG